jgi:hypothetical protein
MFCIIRRLGSVAVIVMFIASCSGAFHKTALNQSLAAGEPQHLRYRVTDVADHTKPGLEWELDPPLSPQHDAVQVLFWPGSGILKICKGGSGRFVSASTSFSTPRPLQDAIFELSTDPVEGDTIITLSFLRNDIYQAAAKLRVPGIHTLSGPTDQYLCTVEEM